MNPLKDLIKAMKDEHKKKHGSTMKARYEIGLLDVESDIPLYDVGSDGRRRRSQPCLTHLSFKLVAGLVHLTALYRAHEYKYKVAGNLLGLARLQDAVATEAGATSGTLTVISTHAFIEGSVTSLRALIDEAA